MPLIQSIKYEPKIKNLEDIQPEDVPEQIRSMLCEVRGDIGELDYSFTYADLTIVSNVIELGKYEFKKSGVLMRVDLSSAKDLIQEYRQKIITRAITRTKTFTAP